MKSDKAEKYDPANIAAKDIDFKLMSKTWFVPLCNFAKKFVSQNDDDIVQDVFLKICEKKDTIFIKGKLSTYLFESVKNNYFDYRKHENIKREYVEKVQTMHDYGDTSMIQDDNDPESIFVSQEQKELLKQAIKKKLPAKQKEIFLLWLDSYNYQEIAIILKITINTVRTQITRAKKTLHKYLDNQREKEK